MPGSLTLWDLRGGMFSTKEVITTESSNFKRVSFEACNNTKLSQKRPCGDYKNTKEKVFFGGTGDGLVPRFKHCAWR